MKREFTPQQLKPVVPKYAWDDSISFQASSEFISADDGMVLYKSDISNKFVDIKMNGDTILALTDTFDVDDIIVDTDRDTDVLGNYVVFLASSSMTSATLPISSMYIEDQDGDVKITTDNTKFVLFNIVSEDINKISLRSGNLALTRGDGGAIILDDYVGGLNQQFSITPSGNWYYVSDLSATSLSAEYSYFGFSKDGKTLTKDLFVDMGGFDSVNKFVAYKNIYRPDYAKTKSTLDPDENRTKTRINLNYLMSCPYYGVNVLSGYATVPFDIIPLKNFKSANALQLDINYTPFYWYDESDSWKPSNRIWHDYDYESGVGETGNSGSVAFRKYDRVYGGGYQLGGYESIHVGYQSKFSTIISLLPDTYTYFHMPKIAVETELSLSNLSKAGAIAGPAPAYSDRIYKKLADYNNYIWWGGDQSQVNNGTWLCAWLSAGDGVATWMERYYNPGKITYNLAMSAENIFNPSEDIIRDVESTMTLTPNSYYKYFHVGKKTIEAQVKSLFGENDDNLILKFSNFDTANGSTIPNASQKTSDGVLSTVIPIKYVPLDISSISTDKSAILLYGGSNIKTQPSTVFDIGSEKTTMMWVYKDNWTNSNKENTSSVIHSNYYNGGDKLEYITHGLYYSSIIPNATSGSLTKAIRLTSDYNQTSAGMIPSNLTSISMAVDLDGNLWGCGINGSNSKIYKSSADGAIVATLEVAEKQYDQILIKDDNEAYLKYGTSYDVLNIHALSATSSGTILNSGSMYFNISGGVQSSTYTHVDIFSDNTICAVNGGGFIVGGVTHSITDITAKHICCDSGTYAYATGVSATNVYCLYRINKSGTETVLVDSYQTANTSTVNRVFLNREVFGSYNSDILYWILPDGLVRKYSIAENSTKLPEKFSTSSNFGYTGTLTVNNSDFSGYKLNKRINTYAYNNNSVLRYSVLLDTTPPIKKSVYWAVSGLDDAWHHVATVKGEGKIELYIDGQLGAETSATSADILYASNNCFAIGAPIIQNYTLSELLGNSQIGTFSGGISEVVVLNKALSPINISGVYDYYFMGNLPIEWPIETSSRNFIENIKTLYKFKVPGMKSQFYNIVVRNVSNILTESEKVEYEAMIRTKADEIMPDHIKLKDVIWK